MPSHKKKTEEDKKNDDQDSSDLNLDESSPESEKVEPQVENYSPDLIAKSNEAFDRNLKIAVDSAANSHSYESPICVNLPIYSYKSILIDLLQFKMNTNEAKTIQKESTDLVNSMVQQFNMKKAARNFERSRITKSGIIDTFKLSQHKINEDIFKKIKIEKKVVK